MKNVWKKLLELAGQLPVFRVVFALEMVILLLLGANCLRPSGHYLFNAGELLYSLGDEVEYVENEESGAYTVYLDENIAETTIAYTDDFRLWPGAYRITVNYSSQVNYEEGAGFSNGNGYLYLNSGQNDTYFRFNKVFLRNGLESAEQTLQVYAPGPVSDLNLSVTFFGLGSLTVSSVEVTEINAYRYLVFLGIMLIFGLMDWAGYQLFANPDFYREKELGILIGVCAAAALPFIADWVFLGENTGEYAYKIVLLTQELSNGNVFPAIYSAALNGYGYASPLFSGQLFWYFPAILYNCGFSLTFVYNFYLIVLSVVTCLLTYWCGMQIFHKSNPALLAAAMYTLSAVRLTNLLTRADLDIVTAQAFLPLVLLGFYRLYSASRGKKIGVRDYWPAAVGLTAVIAANRMTALMAGMLILIFCLALIRRTLERNRLAALVKTAGLTLLMSLAVWLPVLTLADMDLYQDHFSYTIQSSGAYLVQLFNAIVNNYQASDVTGSASNELSLSTGFSVTLGLVLFVVYLFKIRQDGSENGENKGFAKACWVLSVVSLFLSTVYMAYDSLDFLPGRVYTLLTSYQYPWRWLSFAVLFGVFCTAAVAFSEELREVLFGVSPCVLLCVALTLNTGQIYADQLRTSEASDLTGNLEANYGQIGEGEYLLYPTDISSLVYSDLYYDETKGSVRDYHYENNRWLLWADNSSQEELTVDIPVFHYDNYAAYDTETGERIEIATGENQRIRLTIPAGYSGTIAVKYQIPLLWKLAAAVSVVTDIFLAIFLLSGKKTAKMGKLRGK
ncbi:MAG: hypothetical protein LUC90_01455 [Lachnospiraceae bacterium]|nr:hypothetical protein [Lachnospiraceae bacterium]